MSFSTPSSRVRTKEQLVLHEVGYEMLPVNPNPKIKEIRGIRVYRSLEEIDRPVDMVEAFRPREELLGIAKQAVEIKPRRCGGR